MYREEVLPRNDGSPAVLTLCAGELLERAGFQEAFAGIIRKYQGDWPETEILLSSDTYQERERSGAEPPDIFVTTTGQEELLDFSLYLDAWDNEGSLNNSARLIMHHRGGQEAYVAPVDFSQPLFYYRQDWVTAFNKGKDWNGRAKLDTWEHLADSAAKLGDQGRIALSVEPEDLFNSILWSTFGIDRLASQAAGYYLSRTEENTIFDTEGAQTALGLFQTICAAGPEEGSDPVEAFIDGRAGMLIAGYEAADDLSRRLPADSWTVAALPEGDSKSIVIPCDWVGLGISAQTEEPEKAVHFLAYLTGADGNTYMAKLCGTMPLYTEAVFMEPTLLEGPRGLELGLLGDSVSRYASEPYTLKADYLQEAQVAKELDALLAGDITGEEFLTRLEEYHMNILRDYRAENTLLPWEKEPEDQESEVPEA